MKVIYRYRRLRSKWRRAKRLMWSSPGEVRLIELFGGWVIKVTWLRNWHNGHCFTPLYYVGPYFKRHGIVRELRVGSGEYTKFVDFATKDENRKKAIEVLSEKWHRDILAEERRRRELKALGWDVLYLQTLEIKHSPAGHGRKS